MSQSDSILTDMTHVLSPCLDLRSPLHSISEYDDDMKIFMMAVLTMIVMMKLTMVIMMCSALVWTSVPHYIL